MNDYNDNVPIKDIYENCNSFFSKIFPKNLVCKTDEYKQGLNEIKNLNIKNSFSNNPVPDKILSLLADQSKWLVDNKINLDNFDDTQIRKNIDNFNYEYINQYINSYQKVIKNQLESCTNSIDIPGYIILVVISYFLINSMLIKKLYNLKKYKDLENEDENVKLKEKSIRGGISSVTCSLIFALVNFASDNLGQADPSTSTALIGLLFGGTCGFIADIFFGTDIGYKYFDMSNDDWNKEKEKNPKLQNIPGPKAAAFRIAMGNLITTNYLRYIITVLMDSFISLILLKPLLDRIITLPFFKCGYNQAWGNAFVSSLIGIITFQAYANQTRFQWAYPDPGMTSDLAIHPASIFMAATAFAVLFLISNTGSTGINSKLGKIIIVCLLLGSLTFLNMNKIDKSNNINLPKDKIQSTINQQSNKAIDNAENGKILLFVLSAFCIVVALFSSQTASSVRTFSVMAVLGLLVAITTWYYYYNPYSKNDKDKNNVRALSTIGGVMAIFGLLKGSDSFGLLDRNLNKKSIDN